MKNNSHSNLSFRLRKMQLRLYFLLKTFTDFSITGKKRKLWQNEIKKEKEGFLRVRIETSIEKEKKTIAGYSIVAYKIHINLCKITTIAPQS